MRWLELWSPIPGLPILEWDPQNTQLSSEGKATGAQHRKTALLPTREKVDSIPQKDGLNESAEREPTDPSCVSYFILQKPWQVFLLICLTDEEPALSRITQLLKGVEQGVELRAF